MEVILQQLKMYYKGQLLKFGEDWTIDKKEVIFLKSFNKRLIKGRWENIKNVSR